MSLTRLNIAFISPDTSGFNSVLRYSTAQSQFVWDNSEYSFTANYQGSVSGYTSGGTTFPTSWINAIDKFPFASDGNSSDVGDLTQARNGSAGQSSTASGYTSGGSFFPGTPTYSNVIDKFPFSSDANASDVGDLTQARRFLAGHSSDSSGYSSGGDFSPSRSNTIDKFPFASNTNASDVGDLTAIRTQVTGHNSPISGYTSGGFAPPFVNTIDKFPFSTNANATDVGDLTQSKTDSGGNSSSIRGYTTGGYAGTPGVSLNTIDRFPFSSDANAVGVGSLTTTLRFLAAQNSTVSGYNAGGLVNPTSNDSDTNIISKFPFASEGNSSDVGDLTFDRQRSAGQQV